MFGEIAKAIVSEAPLLGSILLGPAGRLGGTLIASAFNGSALAPAELLSKIVSDPDSSSKLKDIETKYGSLLSLAHGMKMPSVIDFHLRIEFEPTKLVESSR